MALLKTLAACAGATVILAGMATGASAYQCKALGVSASSSAAIQAVALAGAKAAWTNKVKAAYGLSWSVWTIAASPTQSCSGAIGAKTCVVRAKPCNYVVQ